MEKGSQIKAIMTQDDPYLYSSTNKCAALGWTRYCLGRLDITKRIGEDIPQEYPVKLNQELMSRNYVKRKGKKTLMRDYRRAQRC